MNSSSQKILKQLVDDIIIAKTPDTYFYQLSGIGLGRILPTFTTFDNSHSEKIPPKNIQKYTKKSNITLKNMLYLL